MGRKEIVAHGTDPAHPVVEAGALGEGQGLTCSSPVAETIGEVNALDSTEVGFLPPQGLHHLLELAFAEDGSDVYLDPASLSSGFDDVRIDQIL